MPSSQIPTGYFSQSYSEARSRFLKAAAVIGAQTYSYKLHSLPTRDLTIDVVVAGNEGNPTLVVSSGVHGVEGYFGSAVQLAWLERMTRKGVPENLRFVFIHAVNPYGFAYGRRVNEDNIDLNRNFLPGPELYQGAPEGYSELNDYLNPAVTPAWREGFYLKSIWNIIRSGGIQPLKNAIAGGQYEFPEGIFFGGKGPGSSARIIQEHCEEWLTGSSKIMHIDFHTGLGSSGTYKLLLTEPVDSPLNKWYQSVFGKRQVEWLKKGKGTAYKASGTLGEWMQHRFKDRDYRFVAAEFGTHHVLRVLRAMRLENSMHHHGAHSERHRRKVKKEMLECFNPQSPEWRRKVVHSALKIMDQGISGLLQIK